MSDRRVMVKGGVVAGTVLIAIALGMGAMRLPVDSAPPEPVPVVVELFTSEGCSSCPPADSVLMDLVQHQPVAGAEVIGLSEHVDYWDRQGWKDPFSNHVFTQRQSAYATASGSSDVYTPQMFVDGGAPFVGSDRSRAISAIQRAATRPKPVVSLKLPSQVPPVMTIAVEKSRATADAPVWFAVVEDGLTSKVTSGENSGHALRHAAVTRRFISVGKTDKDGGFAREVPLDLDPHWKRAALHAVVFVQPGSVGHIAAAGSIALADASK
jgi:hypothetical protein